MPGPVSDAYDPEWGTDANAVEVREALRGVYETVSAVLGNRPPLYVLDLVRADLPELINARLSEWQWRLIRFALERAFDSV